MDSNNKNYRTYLQNIYLHYLYRKLEKLAEARANLLPHLFSSFSPPWLSFGGTMQCQCTLFVGVMQSLNFSEIHFFMSGSSHIQSVLIGVKYRNWRRTLDVYLLFAILLGKIKLSN